MNIFNIPEDHLDAIMSTFYSETGTTGPAATTNDFLPREENSEDSIRAADNPFYETMMPVPPVNETASIATDPMIRRLLGVNSIRYQNIIVLKFNHGWYT